MSRRTRPYPAEFRRQLVELVHAGRTPEELSREFEPSAQAIRNWVVQTERDLRFNAEGPSGLIDRKAPGNPCKLDASQRRALTEMVESGPIPAIHGVVRWRLKDLAQWIWQEFHISLDETTVGRELKTLGFRRISARPRHYAQNELAMEAFKKNSPPHWTRSAPGSRSAPR